MDLYDEEDIAMLNLTARENVNHKGKFSKFLFGVIPLKALRKFAFRLEAVAVILKERLVLSSMKQLNIIYSNRTLTFQTNKPDGNLRFA